MDFGGYPGLHETKSHLRAYGGGEFYLNMKWWMFGSTVAVHPRMIGYHLASSRGYSYDHNDYVANVLAIAYALGMDDWRERAYINWLRKINKTQLDEIMAQNEWEMENERKFIEKRRKFTFNELIAERPWEAMNEKKVGKSVKTLLTFHDTWLPLMEANPVAKEAYKNSKYQKGLEEFINEKLSDTVYKRVPQAESKK